ncbi:MAG: ADP-ribosylglycohydrolase family protein, partial [Alistipes sp.]|nr:ADP-ribosylglycohydrolase family protein [Alistipes sp.]
IPGRCRYPLREIEELEFEGTDVSLAKAYEMSYSHALEMISRAGGEVAAESVTIPQRKAQKLPLEQNFIDTHPVSRSRLDCFLHDEYEFDFDGNGFIIWGNICCLRSVTEDYIHRVSMRHIGSEVFGLAEADDPYVAELEIWIDGRLDHTARLPMKNTARRLEPAWRYLLDEGAHKVALRWTNPRKEYTIRLNDLVVYSENEPAKSDL